MLLAKPSGERSRRSRRGTHRRSRTRSKAALDRGRGVLAGGPAAWEARPGESSRAARAAAPAEPAPTEPRGPRPQLERVCAGEPPSKAGGALRAQQTASARRTGGLWLVVRAAVYCGFEGRAPVVLVRCSGLNRTQTGSGPNTGTRTTGALPLRTHNKHPPPGQLATNLRSRRLLASPRARLYSVVRPHRPAPAAAAGPRLRGLTKKLIYLALKRWRASRCKIRARSLTNRAKLLSEPVKRALLRVLAGAAAPGQRGTTHRDFYAVTRRAVTGSEGADRLRPSSTSCTHRASHAAGPPASTPPAPVRERLYFGFGSSGASRGGCGGFSLRSGLAK
ncbi:unnamed protein product [Pleuronectes platessa]|uniref:Uncharacterized protein n=1 Tax=Pleuronectes platessa TaxID=8262 RepID=A0A9N7UPV0_PLEPL|nr:unnamed protein product [Pleuronectes platessa]